MRNAPKDYFEAKGVEFYKKLVVGYDLVAELFPNRILKLDAEVNLDELTMRIIEVVDKLILAGQPSANEDTDYSND